MTSPVSPFEFTAFRGVSPRGKRARSRHQQLVELLTERHVVPVKELAPGFSPTVYREHYEAHVVGEDGKLRTFAVDAPAAYRCTDAVAALTALVLDSDHHEPDWDELERTGNLIIAYTTWSHTQDDPRWRLVVPLARPVPVEEWPAVWRSGVERFDPHADPQCKDVSRFYFLHGAPRDRLELAQTRVMHGELWLPIIQASSTNGYASGGHTRAERPPGGPRRDLSEKTLDFLVGCKVSADQTQRGAALAASRALQSANYPLEEAQELVWSALRRCPQLDPHRPWTEGEVYGLVADVYLRPPSTEREYEESPGRVSGVGKKREDDDDEEPPDDSSLLAPIPTPPLWVLPRRLRAMVEGSTLPQALTAGAGIAALAVAIGGEASVQFNSQVTRPILWLPLVSPAGAGKSPSIDLMFDPLRRLDDAAQTKYESDLEEYQKDQDRARAAKDAGEAYQANYAKPKPPYYVLLDDANQEVMVRMLDQVGSRGLVLDELKQLLAGLGEYKRQSGSDVARLLKAWAGSPIVYARVNVGAVPIRVPKPTLVICGALVPGDQALLGEEADGLRSRWLIHLASRSSAGEQRDPDQAVRQQWAELLERLRRRARDARQWLVKGEAYDELQGLIAEWNQRYRAEDASPIVQGLLSKATTHVLRLALVIGEAGAVELDDAPEATSLTIQRASLWFEFCLECAAALPAGKALSVGRVAEKVDPSIDRVVAWLDTRDGWINAKKLLENGVAGIKTRATLKAVIDQFEAMYARAVKHEKPPTGGRSVTWLRSPRRSR